jgi:uncharacterized protein
VKNERYDLASEPRGFTWFNRPAHFEFHNGLTIEPSGNTDFWQRTHYGFRRDDGHAFLKRVTGDFTFTTEARFKPLHRYDQCGVFARVDAANWVKASVEYEADEPSKLGSVVTNLGFSDWATQEIGRSVSTMHYRLSRRESDVLIEWSRDGAVWKQMRITHLQATVEEIEVGIYACSPESAGFRCTFTFIEIGECLWTIPSGA